MMLLRQAHKIAQANTFKRSTAVYYRCTSSSRYFLFSSTPQQAQARSSFFFSTTTSSVNMSTTSPPTVHGLFHKDTSTMTYIVTDPVTSSTLIIDSVLDYDASSGRTSNTHNTSVTQYCNEHKLNVQYILESHVHADHLTGAKYLKSQYPNAQTGIGANVTQVQKTFAGIFNYTPDDLPTDGSQFDLLFKDGDTFPLGELTVEVVNTPGHTPACVCYIVKTSDGVPKAVFTGDTIFMPDFGTARCDFPGGSSEELYTSIKRLYQTLPDDTRVYVGHDYQPGGRELLFTSTIGEEKASNKQLKNGTSQEEFTVWRSERDEKLGMPKLLLPSIQVNLRNGEFPNVESNGVSYLKIPINLLGGK